MGYRSGKEIADVIEADKLWRKVLGARVPQIDLSRLVCVLAEVGVDPLRVTLLASAAEGVSALHLDGDSRLLELHGKQEGGAFNGHYKECGYHAGWLLDASGRLSARWLNEGNAHTADGQAEKLAWMLEQGVRIGSYRGEAGMPSAGLMGGLEGMGATYAMRSRSNSRLDEVAQAICPELPKVGGGKELKPRPSLKPIKGEGGWSVLANAFAMGRVKPSLVGFRAFDLKLANAFLDHARSHFVSLRGQ